MFRIMAGLARCSGAGASYAYIKDKMYSAYITDVVHDDKHEITSLGDNVYALNDKTVSNQDKALFNERAKTASKAFRHQDCHDPLYFFGADAKKANVVTGALNQQRVALVEVGQDIQHDELYPVMGHEGRHHIDSHERQKDFATGVIFGINPVLGVCSLMTKGHVLSQVNEMKADIYSAQALGTGKDLATYLEKTKKGLHMAHPPAPLRIQCLNSSIAEPSNPKKGHR